MSAEDRGTAYATLQVVGDQLDPANVSALLGLEPTFAVRKGERFRRGRSGREYTGRTGVWNLDTKDAISSVRLQDHLEAIADLLTPHPDRLAGLRTLAQQDGNRAGVSCFWFGPAEAEPEVPDSFRDLVASFGGEIDTDFHHDFEVGAQTAAE